MTLIEHAQGIAEALGREWELPTGTAMRAWHALYQTVESEYGTETVVWVYASIGQTRAVPGFTVRYVAAGHENALQAPATALAAAVWLGLDVVADPLDWRLEL